MAVATLDKRKQRIIFEDGSLRTYDLLIKKFVVARWGDMTPEQQAWYRNRWPDFQPDGESPFQDGTDSLAPTSFQLETMAQLLEPAPVRSQYSRQIQQFEQRAEQLNMQADSSADDNRYGRLKNNASQFLIAAELLREAEDVEPGADVSFGYAPNYGMFTRIPPSVSGFETFEPITIHFHTYRTNDPIRIAWLRRLIRERADENLSELDSHDIDAAISFDGKLMGWFPRAIVEEMRRAGGARKAGA